MASNTQIAIVLLLLMSAVFALGWQAREIFGKNKLSNRELLMICSLEMDELLLQLAKCKTIQERKKITLDIESKRKELNQLALNAFESI